MLLLRTLNFFTEFIWVVSSSPTPCNQQGHLQLGLVAQSPVQPVLEHFQAWVSTTPLGNLFQCFTPNHNLFFAYIYSTSTLLYF